VNTADDTSLRITSLTLRKRVLSWDVKTLTLAEGIRSEKVEATKSA